MPRILYHTEKTKQNKTKQKTFHSLYIRNGLSAAEWKRSSCMPTTPPFVFRVLWKGNEECRVNRKKGIGLSRAALTCHKHELSSTVISHPIFPRLFLQSNSHKSGTTMSRCLREHAAWRRSNTCRPESDQNLNTLLFQKMFVQSISTINSFFWMPAANWERQNDEEEIWK